MNFIKIFFLFSAFFYSVVAEAYIGPGLGLGTIATVLGVFFGLLLLLAGLIWYPCKILLKKLRKKK